MRVRSLLPPFSRIALVAAGGALGALARAALSGVFPVAGGAYPWTTFAVNLSGAFLLAVLLTLLASRPSTRGWAAALLGTGVLGAYTTFATVGLELHLLVADGHVGTAAWYLAATAAGGTLSGGLGVLSVRLLRRDARR